MALLSLACGGGGPPPPSGPPSTVPGSPAWRASSTPIAIEYLRTLPDSQVGQPISGIALSDGGRWLEGFVYRGIIPVDAKGMNVAIFTSPLGEPLPLVWIDRDGEPWPLPACAPEQKGVRARTLSGQVYTWKALQPGHGIVSPACPPDDWPAPGPRGESS